MILWLLASLVIQLVRFFFFSPPQLLSDLFSFLFYLGERSPLQILASVLKRMRWLTTAHAIETAAVPVVKLVFQFENTLLHVDITFDFSSYVAMHSESDRESTGFHFFFFFFSLFFSHPFFSLHFISPFQRKNKKPFVKHRGLEATKLVKELMEELKPLRPLALVLKQFLFERNLSNPYTGGLSSYCLGFFFFFFFFFQPPQLTQLQLVLMIASFLRVNEACCSTGALLVHFLTFFGRHFQFHKMGISISKRSLFFFFFFFLIIFFGFFLFPFFSPPPSLFHRGYFYLSVPSPTLVIEDPFESSVNIGKGVFAMYRIKAAFNYALSALLSPSPYPYDRAPRLLSRVIDLNWQGKTRADSSSSLGGWEGEGRRGEERRAEERREKVFQAVANISVPSVVSSPTLTQSPISSIPSLSHNPPSFSSNVLGSHSSTCIASPFVPEGQQQHDGGQDDKLAQQKAPIRPRRQFSQAELRSNSYDL